MRVILAYKNFASNRGVSHIGLGVAGMNTSKSLRDANIECDVWPVNSGTDLHDRLTSDDGNTITHVVVSAPWIPSVDLQRMAMTYPNVEFAVNCHSNVGFLQADPHGTQLLREVMELEVGTHNLHLAGNSLKFCAWIKQAFGAPCAYLPNLYFVHPDTHRHIHRPGYSGGTLRIGIFGATRPQKNLVSAVGAALAIGRLMKAETEIWVNGGRTEGGNGILNAAKALIKGVPGISLVESNWQTWPQFRQTVSNMHLLLQPSYTESFNMVTADGVVSGVPSVVTDAIHWAPDRWKAHGDEVDDLARTGLSLLSDPYAPQDGLDALNCHNSKGMRAWRYWLGLDSNSSFC